jgi:hypothetical protein
MRDKKDFCEKGKCTAQNLDEVRSCKNYDPTIMFNTGGCDHLAPRSGKCLRPVK